MDKMTPEIYMAERVDNQVTYYEKRSSVYKRNYLGIKVSEISLAAMIPFLSGLINKENDYLKYSIGGMGACIAILAGTLLIFKYKEKWTSFRATSEALKKEKYLYLTNIGIYKETDTFSLFVERIEGILSKENIDWTQYATQVGKS